MTLWLLVQGFSDLVSCYVLGYVYAMPDEAVSFVRVDSCEAVRHEVDETKLVLHSPHHWVVIPLPPSGGNVKLWYRWGSDKVHIGSDDYEVRWGRVLKG